MTDGRTDGLTYKDDYYGPHLVNSGSKKKFIKWFKGKLLLLHDSMSLHSLSLLFSIIPWSQK